MSNTPESFDDEFEQEAACPHTALHCLEMAARKCGIDVSVSRICHDHVLGNFEPTTTVLLRIARELGLRARSEQLTWEDLPKLDEALPVIVRLHNGNSMLIVGVTETAGTRTVILSDPLAGSEALIALDETRFMAAWTGETIFIKRQYSIMDKQQPFGFTWFIPLLIQQRRLFRDVAATAIMLSFLGLAPAMFVQLVLDRVIVHQSIGTLKVLAIGVIAAILFDTIFTYVRRYMLLYASTRIDAQVNVQTFNKLMSLPITYFEKSSTGVTIKNMQQAEKIRNFMTGPLFTTALDSLTLIVFLPAMFMYSVQLATVVLFFTFLMCISVAVFLPALKRFIMKAYEADAAQQSFLVETIQGMRTVKSLALDAKQRHEWDLRVARSLKLRFDLGKMALAAQTITMPVEKLMMVSIIGYGSYLVFEGAATIGTLIAFQMITARVAAPLIQLSGLIQQFQETALSVKMLALIMNQEPEQGRTGRGLRTPLVGKIEFDNLRFRYPGATGLALDNVSFTIQEGTIYGVMGRSGSGKTTITRLLQGLHDNYEGLIKVDGHDLREIDLDHLRTSIGVVLQDNFLFRGTIRENISAAKSNASFEEVMEAARLAGADEFIERLPRGFDTLIEEGSANLSGGQRQRLAIARALLVNPRILILDEATSALDAESEAIVQANLMSIAEGRTVIVISHRLSSLVPANAILVLEHGKVIDQGRHHELLVRCDIYKHMWYQQNRHIDQDVTHERALPRIVSSQTR